MAKIRVRKGKPIRNLAKQIVICLGGVCDGCAPNAANQPLFISGTCGGIDMGLTFTSGVDICDCGVDYVAVNMTAQGCSVGYVKDLHVNVFGTWECWRVWLHLWYNSTTSTWTFSVESYNYPSDTACGSFPTPTVCIPEREFNWSTLSCDGTSMSGSAYFEGFVSGLTLSVGITYL